MTKLTIIRGLPGSGKTTLAKKLKADVIHEADNYFITQGSYKFNAEQLPLAHAQCLKLTEQSLKEDKDVAVCNTFSQDWEIIPYLHLARETGSSLTIIDLYDQGLTDEQLAARNVHQVPLHVIANMRQRWQSNKELQNMGGQWATNPPHGYIVYLEPQYQQH